MANAIHAPTWSKTPDSTAFVVLMGNSMSGTVKIPDFRQDVRLEGTHECCMSSQITIELLCAHLRCMELGLATLRAHISHLAVCVMACVTPPSQRPACAASRPSVT
mmetsp:Transcript_48538/g.109362  ORF Transcript_48538/g.109362 Transcript_48538/m.109362 type:complete len:106 (+) Transcript_48538:210-527(+)